MTGLTKAQILRDTVKERFYPYASEIGFIRGKADAIACPFHRICGDRVHWFEIQWDKYHRPCFVINFSEFALIEGMLEGNAASPEGRLQR